MSQKQIGTERTIMPEVKLRHIPKGKHRPQLKKGSVEQSPRGVVQSIASEGKCRAEP